MASAPGVSEDRELATVALCAQLPLQRRFFALQGADVSIDGIQLCLELWGQRRIARIALQAGGHVASPCLRSADLQREKKEPTPCQEAGLQIGGDHESQDQQAQGPRRRLNLFTSCAFCTSWTFNEGFFLA